jgi:hypothetical protein
MTVTVTQPILMVTALNSAADCAAEVAKALQCSVEIAESRKSALAALRRTEFAAIVVDDAVAEADWEGAEQLWRASELAVPLQLNFAICSCARVVRELRAALYRRSLEEGRARKAAETHLQADIGSALTGIVLELDLLKRSPQLPVELQDRLQHVSSLTGELRKKLVPSHAAKSATGIAVGSPAGSGQGSWADKEAGTARNPLQAAPAGTGAPSKMKLRGGGMLR